MLELKKVTKNFADEVVVDDLDLRIREGEFFSILGPSGCGKTTLLRMIAGLETVSAGQILLDGKSIESLSPQARPFNMVFQRYALFPHLTVAENVAFGLQLKKLPTTEVQKRIAESLALVNMLTFRDRLPETLSGGQCQRVAIARALVNQPKVLLLDEPLSALDQKLREHMQAELKLLQRRLGLTFIYVTHDQEEALALSDRVAVMSGGRIEQVSAPKDLYEDPQTLFTAQFVGSMITLEGHFVEVLDGYAKVRYQDHFLKARAKSCGVGSDEVFAMVRPEKVCLLQEAPPLGNWAAGRVAETVFRGTQIEVIVEVAGNHLVKALVSPQSPKVAIGSQVYLSFEAKDTFLFAGHCK